MKPLTGATCPPLCVMRIKHVFIWCSESCSSLRSLHLASVKCLKCRSCVSFPFFLYHTRLLQSCVCQCEEIMMDSHLTVYFFEFSAHAHWRRTKPCFSLRRLFFFRDIYLSFSSNMASLAKHQIILVQQQPVWCVIEGIQLRT